MGRRTPGGLRSSDNGQAARPSIGGYASLACPALRRNSVKKLLLLLIVIALGAAIAKKVRTA